jgi:glutamate synthase (NADPH/NADH) small chain
MGHQVVVYEKASHPGGLLRYGIPDFKLEKWVVDRRLKQLQAEGVLFRCGVEVGRDVDLSHLMEVHDIVGLTVGAEKPRELNIPGRDLKGIHLAMDFLTAQNEWIALHGHGDSPVNARDKQVVILGGGDTGSDCLATVLRQGAQSVLQFEVAPEPPKDRSPLTPWPYWPLKLRSSHAHEEGGDRLFGIGTTAFIGENGQLTGLATTRLESVSGKLQPLAGSEQVVPADMVILAIGFEGVSTSVRKAMPMLKYSGGNTLWTDAQYMTSVKGVFAAGDVRRGASLIVWAIAEGRKMAAAMDRFLS